MNTVHIISHCWCPPGLDIYAQSLKWQMSSLIRNTTHRAKALLTVCCSESDSVTMEMYAKCKSLNSNPNVQFEQHLMDEGGLFRRAIGRNEVSKVSKHSVVWFCDCDYVFGESCLQAVIEQVIQDDTLYYPKFHVSNSTFEEGDEIILRNRLIDYPEIDFPSFVPRKLPRAIGGVQIITGNTARRIGYLDNTKWTRPVDPQGGFRNTSCDISFRKTVTRGSVCILIPNLYRIRHKISGLFVDREGKAQ